MSTAELRARLDKLNATIEQDQVLADERKKQRRRITRILNLLVYPVITLPPEIVSLIFLHCIPYPPQWAEPDDNWRCPAPLVLLHICRTWRNIRLADSSLWTTPHLQFDKYYIREMSFNIRTHEQIENFLASWVR
ncbi:hypothetical protein B0H19DRAFT_69938 [Mycena capillaripes]|nr:hypothetical protein B0H19DRAFT_69938 [Mycena capillaripes]